jgi:hypothetical protein
MNPNPIECYVLETFSSVPYFASLRDTWALMIEHLELTLDKYMRHLPLDYRARKLSEQPDFVWGNHVIPNFKTTLQCLSDGLIRRTHGDLAALSEAHGVMMDFKGQTEYSSEWMSRDDENRYGELINKCTRMASNMVATIEAWWKPGNLTDPQVLGETISIPSTLPRYSLDPTISTKTGMATPMTGIYAPAIGDGCIEFLVAPAVAPKAQKITGTQVLIDNITKQPYGTQPVYGAYETEWILVTRSAEQNQLSSNEKRLPIVDANRVLAGQPCPATGYYFSPADPNSRQKFNENEIMPNLGEDYGITIWQLESPHS